MSLQHKPASGVGSTVEISEIESLAKGTIIVGDGDGAPSSIVIGADNTILQADSAQVSGVAWRSEVGIGIAPVTGVRLTLPQEDDAVTPTLAFGDGDTGFYERVDDDLRVVVGGVNQFLFFQTQFRSAQGTGPAMINVGATSFTPTLIPDISDSNTGIGQAAADQLSLIAGSVEQARFQVSGNQVINSLLDVATGNEVALSLNYTTNKATSGDDTGLVINQTDTLSPGASLLADFQVGGTSQFSVDNTGVVVITGDVEVGSTNAFHYGNPTTDATWKTVRSGTKLSFQRREAGVYVEKGFFDASFHAPLIILEADGTKSAPCIAFASDLDTGLFRQAENVMSMVAGGVECFRANTAVAAVNCFNFTPAATGVNPTLSVAGSDANIGLTISPKGTGALRLIGSGSAGVGIGIAAVAGTRLTLPQENDAVTPTLAFGDGNTGFYESADNTLAITLGGVQQFSWSAGGNYDASSASGPRIRNATPSSTLPNIIISKTGNTGLGGGGNQLSLITGGVEQMSLSITGNHIVTSLLDAATGNEAALTLNYTVNKATSGNDTGLVINQTDTLSPGTSLLMDLQQGGTSRFSIDAAGNISIGATIADELTHIARAVDGEFTGLLIENSQANEASSTNETAEIRFGFGGNNDVARISVVKKSDYTTVANEDSAFGFWIDLNGTITKVASVVNSGLLLGVPASKLDFFGDAGGGNQGIRYKDAGGSLRSALAFPGSDLVVLSNQAANGVVEIRANTVTAGSGGEVTVATFEDTGVGIGVTPSSILSFQMGTGSGSAEASGKANVNTTAVGTDADTVEKDLLTYSLPANSLSADGKLVRVTAWGSVATNGNTKTIRLKFGATILRAIGPSGMSGLDWRIDGLVIRTGATTQDAMATEALDVSAQDTTISTPTETLSGIVVVKVTGQNGTASANDIIAKGMLVEYLN